MLKLRNRCAMISPSRTIATMATNMRKPDAASESFAVSLQSSPVCLSRVLKCLYSNLSRATTAVMMQMNDTTCTGGGVGKYYMYGTYIIYFESGAQKLQRRQCHTEDKTERFHKHKILYWDGITEILFSGLIWWPIYVISWRYMCTVSTIYKSHRALNTITISDMLLCITMSVAIATTHHSNDSKNYLHYSLPECDGGDTWVRPHGSLPRCSRHGLRHSSLVPYTAVVEFF